MEISTTITTLPQYSHEPADFVVFRWKHESPYQTLRFMGWVRLGQFLRASSKEAATLFGEVMRSLPGNMPLVKIGAHFVLEPPIPQENTLFFPKEMRTTV